MTEDKLTQPSLRKLIFDIFKKTKMDMEKRFADSGLGITPYQHAILYVLNSGPCTINDLARTLIIQPPSLVPPVDHLEKDGLLKRRTDPLDRRKIQLDITEKGKEIIKMKLFEDKNDKLNIAFNSFSKTDQVELLTLLKQLDYKLNNEED